jgi:hypothetical protein
MRRTAFAVVATLVAIGAIVAFHGAAAAVRETFPSFERSVERLARIVRLHS